MAKCCLVVASRRDRGDWEHFDLMQRSVHYYSPLIIISAWKGSCSPPEIEGAQYYQQPESANTFGMAYKFAVEKAMESGYDEFVIANDDIIFTPSTYEKLMLTVDSVENAGFVACQSNYVRLDPPRVVSPVCAWVSAKSLEGLDWPDCNWYSDDILCYDMQKKGLNHYVSDAYVHHIGEHTCRKPGEVQADVYARLHLDGYSWVMQHRPDFAKFRGWSK
jgi:hypothetical protein